MNLIIGLGSNRPDAAAKISEAKAALIQCQCNILAESGLYNVSGDYLNEVISVEANVDIDILERKCKEIEISLGRDGKAREKGEVPIDIDIVVCDGYVLRQSDYMQEYFRKGYRKILNIPDN